MYLALNEGKSVIEERFIRTLKTKIYKYMAKNVLHRKKCVHR